MADTSLEQQLLQERVSGLELDDYCIVISGTTVRDVIARMRLKKQNCAFILGEGTRLLGVLTDRDVLKKIVKAPDTWGKPVDEFMTAAPDTLPGEASAQDALALMNERHYRNVPIVLEDGAVLGNVTYYAILTYLTDHFADDVYNLPPDPENYASQRAGG